MRLGRCCALRSRSDCETDARSAGDVGMLVLADVTEREGEGNVGVGLDLLRLESLRTDGVPTPWEGSGGGGGGGGTGGDDMR